MSLAIFIPECEVRALAPTVGEGRGSLRGYFLQALGRWAEEEEEGRDSQECLKHVSLMLLQVRLQYLAQVFCVKNSSVGQASVLGFPGSCRLMT
jgi:hypothetical protein